MTGVPKGYIAVTAEVRDAANRVCSMLGIKSAAFLGGIARATLKHVRDGKQSNAHPSFIAAVLRLDAAIADLLAQRVA